MTASILHPGANRSCRLCGGLGITVGRQQAWAHASLCSCVDTCPKCRGTQWVTSTSEDGGRPRKVRCTCARVEGRMRLFNEAKIPGRYAQASFDTFKRHDAASTAAYAMAFKYLQDYKPGQDNRGLILHGDVGRGKTHLMIALLRELIFRYGVSVRFVEFSHLLADLKMSFDRRSGSSGLLEPLSRVTVLAIDEMGKGRNTEFEGTVLDELISRRYNAAATVIATTNYEPGQATHRPAPNLAAAQKRPHLIDRVGDRVYSRLRESCLFIPVRGDDYREGSEYRRANLR